MEFDPQDLSSLTGGVDLTASVPPELATIFQGSLGSSIGAQDLTQNLQAISATPEVTPPTPAAAATPVDTVLADSVTSVRSLGATDPVANALANDLEAALTQTFGTPAP